MPWSVMDLYVSFQWHSCKQCEQNQSELQKINHREMASDIMAVVGHCPTACLFQKSRVVSSTALWTVAPITRDRWATGKFIQGSTREWRECFFSLCHNHLESYFFLLYLAFSKFSCVNLSSARVLLLLRETPCLGIVGPLCCLECGSVV